MPIGPSPMFVPQSQNPPVNTRTIICDVPTNQCGHCGSYHNAVCPRIAEIEYHGDGSIKRIAYFRD